MIIPVIVAVIAAILLIVLLVTALFWRSAWWTESGAPVPRGTEAIEAADFRTAARFDSVRSGAFRAPLST